MVEIRVPATAPRMQPRMMSFGNLNPPKPAPSAALAGSAHTMIRAK
jgi:hypothetical protein